jgi:hypothetical protein
VVRILKRPSVVTVASTRPQEISVAQLKHCGLVLYPREVVALVHALCDQQVCVPTPGDLSLTDAGQVLVRDGAGATGAAPFLTTMGVLIEALLPPFSEERQYAPAASLHMLPARLRGTTGPPIVSTPELLYVIQHYETDAPARVLQQLVARAAAALDRPARESVTSGQGESESAVLRIVAFEGRDDSLDEYPSEQVVGRRVDYASLPDRLPLGPVVPDAPEIVSTSAPRSRVFALLAVLCVGTSLGLSGYGAYRVVHRLDGNDWYTSVVRALELSPSLSAHPIGSGIGTLIPSRDEQVSSRSESLAGQDHVASTSGSDLPHSEPTATDDRDQDRRVDR